MNAISTPAADTTTIRSDASRPRTDQQNATGFGAIYRARLAEAFEPEPTDIAQPEPEAAEEATPETEASEGEDPGDQRDADGDQAARATTDPSPADEQGESGAESLRDFDTRVLSGSEAGRNARVRNDFGAHTLTHAAEIDLSQLAAKELTTPAEPAPTSQPARPAKTSGGAGEPASDGRTNVDTPQPKTAQPADSATSRVARTSASLQPAEATSTKATPDAPATEPGVSATTNTPATPEPTTAHANGARVAAVVATAGGSGASGSSGGQSNGAQGVRGIAQLERTLGRSVRTKAPEAPPQGKPERPVLAQVEKGLASLLSKRGGSVTLRLQPHELGKVTVELKLDAGTASVSVRAGTEQARSLLSEDLDALRASLEARGVRVERLTVEPAGGTEPGSNARYAQDAAAGQTASEGRGEGRSDAHAGGGPSEENRSRREGPRDGERGVGAGENGAVSHDTRAAEAALGLDTVA